MDKILKEVWQMAEANSLQAEVDQDAQERARRPTTASSRSQMNLAGDFNGFYAFLLQLEKLPRITRVDADEAEEDQRPRWRDAGADHAEHLL